MILCLFLGVSVSSDEAIFSVRKPILIPDSSYRVRVPQDCETISEAILAVCDNGVIEIDPGPPYREK